MLRHLLASTALVVAVTAGAYAETKPQVNAEGDAAQVNAVGVYEFEMNTIAPSSATSGFLASNMIGESVMTGETDEAESIGDINDVVIGRDGNVRAVIIGVGGFLGLGEKDVAIEFDRLTFVSANEGEYRVVTDASRQELEDAPAYERPNHIPNWMTTSGVRDEMNKVSDSVSNTYETVRKEGIDPAKKRLDQAMQNDAEMTGKRVDAKTVSTEEIIGAYVYTATDGNIGEISQVLLDTEGTANAVVIEVGGFLGFGEKPVAVSFDSLEMFETENGDLTIQAPFTKEELEAAKTFDPEAYKDRPESNMLNS